MRGLIEKAFTGKAFTGVTSTGGRAAVSLAAGTLLLTTACSSSGSVTSGGGSGGAADGSLGGSPRISAPKAGASGASGASADAETPDGTADPAVCAVLTGKAADDENQYKQLVATRQKSDVEKGVATLAGDVVPLGRQAKGPLSLLVSALIIETANDGLVARAGDVPVGDHSIFPAVRAACDAHAANTATVAICDKVEQDWASAADAVLAAKDDTHAWSAAIRKLADQSAADAAPAAQQRTDQQIRLTVAVRSIKNGMVQDFDQSPTMYADNSTEQSAINIASECAGGTALPLQ